MLLRGTPQAVILLLVVLTCVAAQTSTVACSAAPATGYVTVTPQSTATSYPVMLKISWSTFGGYTTGCSGLAVWESASPSAPLQHWVAYCEPGADAIVWVLIPNAVTGGSRNLEFWTSGCAGVDSTAAVLTSTGGFAENFATYRNYSEVTGAWPLQAGSSPYNAFYCVSTAANFMIPSAGLNSPYIDVVHDFVRQPDLGLKWSWASASTVSAGSYRLVSRNMPWWSASGSRQIGVWLALGTITPASILTKTTGSGTNFVGHAATKDNHWALDSTAITISSTVSPHIYAKITSTTTCASSCTCEFWTRLSFFAVQYLPDGVTQPLPTVQFGTSPSTSATPSMTGTPVATPTPTAAATLTATPTPTSASTPSSTPASTPAPTPQSTITPTADPTPSGTASPDPTVTPTRTPTHTASVTADVTPTSTPASTPAVTPAATAAATPTITPIPTLGTSGSGTPTLTPTQLPTSPVPTPSLQSLSGTHTLSPSASQTPSASVAPYLPACSSCPLNTTAALAAITAASVDADALLQITQSLLSLGGSFNFSDPAAVALVNRLAGAVTGVLNSTKSATAATNAMSAGALIINSAGDVLQPVVVDGFISGLGSVSQTLLTSNETSALSQAVAAGTSLLSSLSGRTGSAQQSTSLVDSAELLAVAQASSNTSAPAMSGSITLAGVSGSMAALADGSEHSMGDTTVVMPTDPQLTALTGNFTLTTVLWSNGSFPSNSQLNTTARHVFTVSLLTAEASRQSVANLSTPVRLSFPVPDGAALTDIGCVSFDPAVGAWTSDGCELDVNASTAGFAVCLCTHMTDFSVLVTTDGSPSESSGGSSTFPTGAIVGIVLGAAAVLCACVFVVGVIAAVLIVSYVRRSKVIVLSGSSTGDSAGDEGF